MAIPFTSQLFFGISMAIYLLCFLGYSDLRRIAKQTIRNGFDDPS